MFEAIFITPFVEMAEYPYFLAEVIISGLLTGVLYSLVALGFVLIFKASGVFNFAQGMMMLFAGLTVVGLMEHGLSVWLAILLTVIVMIGLAFSVERLVMRPLVNQDHIIMFMATIGLAYFLDGFGQTIWGSDVKTVDMGMPSGQWFIGPDDAILINRFELFAAGVAAALVIVLAVLFQKTKIGRALRAVADDHQAAMSVGIPLNHIWVIVWSVAGIVAIVARDHVGSEGDRAVLTLADRAQGAAGADSGRVYLNTRCDCWRVDYRGG